MISDKRHTETDPGSGRNLYIIETYMNPKYTDGQISINTAFNGERFGIPFRKGVGRTVSRLKAKWCSENLGYKVYIHQDDTPWEEGVASTQVDDDSSVVLIDNEDEY